MLATDRGNDRLCRQKRQEISDEQIYLNSIGPEELKAQNEIRAGLESILPWIIKM